MSELSKLTIRDTEHSKDKYGRHLLKVKDPHALVQAAGYLKYIYAKNKCAVHFRGQTTNHKTLSPSLFRGNETTQKTLQKKIQELKKLTDLVASRCSIFNKFDRVGYEPLLQHYGVRTTWIDLVDNIWIALWFACHKAFSSKEGRYLHFERRNALRETGGSAFIYCIECQAEPTKFLGHWRGKKRSQLTLGSLPLQFLSDPMHNMAYFFV